MAVIRNEKMRIDEKTYDASVLAMLYVRNYLIS